MLEQQQQLNTKIIQLNKNALIQIQKNHMLQAYQYLKNAQQIINNSLRRNQKVNVNRLAGITYNNFACYYKKMKRPKVALNFLKKALKIQVSKVQDWASTAKTHLNICAIYSFLTKHEEASDHAMLAIAMLDKKLQNSAEQTNPEICQIRILANYNLAIEKQHLKKWQQSIKYYKLTIIEAKKQIKKKHLILIDQCEQSIKHLEKLIKENNLKMLTTILQRKQDEKKGHYQFMRKNKKNFIKYCSSQVHQQLINPILRKQKQINKFEIYKTQVHRPNYSSAQKMHNQKKSLKPVQLHSNTSIQRNKLQIPKRRFLQNK